MKQVLLIQGGGKGTHESWDTKILESLERELGSDYAIRYPRMPHEAEPKYAAWKTRPLRWASRTRRFRLNEGNFIWRNKTGS